MFSSFATLRTRTRGVTVWNSLIIYKPVQLVISSTESRNWSLPVIKPYLCVKSWEWNPSLCNFIDSINKYTHTNHVHWGGDPDMNYDDFYMFSIWWDNIWTRVCQDRKNFMEKLSCARNIVVENLVTLNIFIWTLVEEIPAWNSKHSLSTMGMERYRKKCHNWLI